MTDERNRLRLELIEAKLCALICSDGVNTFTYEIAKTQFKLFHTDRHWWNELISSSFPTCVRLRVRKPQQEKLFRFRNIIMFYANASIFKFCDLRVAEVTICKHVPYVTCFSTRDFVPKPPAGTLTLDLTGRLPSPRYPSPRVQNFWHGKLVTVRPIVSQVNNVQKTDKLDTEPLSWSRS